MGKPATNVIAFNAAAGLVTVAALAAVVRSFVFAPASAPCSERYANATFFALERAGVVLTAADLQSGVGGRDAGLIDNVAILKAKDAPSPAIMTIGLPKGSSSPHVAEGPKAGMSFPWEPRALQGKSAACLAYHVHLPADFDFGRGGVLPGLRGAGAEEPAGDGFVAHLAWRPRARGGATLRLTADGATKAAPAEREAFAFPRGRWVKLEQEVVLNAPGKAEGTLRVWVDGALAIDRSDVAYRSKPEVAISAIAADVFYGADGVAPADATVRLSPFEARWK
jgi:hypothetical protein